MTFPFEYQSVRTTNFVEFDRNGIIPAGKVAVVVDYNAEINRYIIEANFPDNSLIGCSNYDVAEVDRDDFEVI